MKKLVILICLCLSVLVACNSSQKGKTIDSEVTVDQTTANREDSLRQADSLRAVAKKAAFKEYKLNAEYTVIDTGWFNCGTMEGLYAIVKQNEQSTDTLHLGIGMQKITSSKYMYLTLTKCHNSYDSWPGILYLSPNQYIVSSQEKKYSLQSAATGFDNYKSAPNVINGKIYFWQYTKESGDIFKVSAAVYNPETGETNSRYIFSSDLGDSEHIFPPFEKHGKIVFDWENRLWEFSSNNF